MNYINKFKSNMYRQHYVLKRNVAGFFENLVLKLDGSYQSNLSISLCTAVKDRFDHLEKTFLHNIYDNKDYSNCEFILLNYSCPDPRTERWVRSELKTYIDEGKVKYYLYPDGKHFQMAHSRNLAFRLAQGEVVCNVDADNFLGSGFVYYVSAVLSRNNFFLRGPRDGRGLGGRICVRRKDWELVGGYDERIKNWGPEDLDFANRLCMAGLKQKFILSEKFCHTISHSDELRFRHSSENNKESLMKYKEIISKNRELGIISPNNNTFGHGRVQKNFVEWHEV